MGGGIAAMHYIGMDAMRLPAMCHYSRPLFILSVILAIVISFVALWLTFHLRGDAATWRKTISALVMGAAIPVMHYTGMAAATFTPSMSGHGDLSHAVGVSSLSVAGISIVTFLVLGSVLLTGFQFNSLSNTRQLTVRYFASLSAISLLAILGTVLVEHQAQKSQSNARVINVAGRQRMLSQAIVKDVLLLANTPSMAERQRLVADLREQDSVWEHAHSALQYGDPLLSLPGTNSPQVQQRFTAIEPEYRPMAEAVQFLLVKESRQESTTHASLELEAILTHEGPYLQSMDGIVSEYEREATFRDDRKNQLHFGLLLSILGILVLQGLVVLRPALARIQEGIGQLILAKQDLQRKATFVELLQVVAVAANEATSVEAALQFTIDRICEYTGWPVGHVYLRKPGSNRELTSSGLWHFDDATRFENFRKATETTPLTIGLGLPGRVVERGKPTWIPNIDQDSNFPRRKAALDLGVKGAFGFPVIAQGEVVAVLEFFSKNIEQPDNELLTVMSHVGEQLGQLRERKRAEGELARRAEELARSNAELQMFAYVASHDLQEPLRMVASYTQLLARRYKGKLGNDADEFIGFAVDGAKRMQTLIQDLLSYSRVTTKGQSFQLTHTEAACKSAIQGLHASIRESGASVTVGPLPDLVADGAQLTQLFQNLIGNAIKYRDGRTPEIDVAAKPNGNEWVFSVQDNGIGIQSQYFERIFQMFQRLHTRVEYSGTGIGLAICQKIVERHGGRIWVESQPGEGSTFLFTIPRAERSST